MRTGIFIFVLALATAQTLVAQTPTAQQESYTFNLKQCVEYALESNVSVKNAILDQEASKARVNEVRAMGFPQVNGSIGFQHANPLRAFYGEVGGSPFLQPGVNGLTAADVGKVKSFPNFFQLGNTGDMSVTINQLILSSSYIIGLEAAGMYKKLMERATEVNRQTVVENVTKSYYMVLVNLERKNLFDVNIARLDSVLQQTKALNKGGFAESIDADRLQVQLNNLITEKQKFENLLLLSNIALRYQMGYPLDKELVLAERISNFSLEIPNLEIEEKFDYEKRAEMQLQKQNIKLLKKDYDLTVWSFAPTLAGSINFGWFTQNKDFDFWKTNNGWANYATYSIGLNVPIFDGFSKIYQGQQKKVAIIKAENSYKNFENVIDLQIRSSKITYKNAIQSLETQKKNIDLADRVAKVSKIKYQQGVGSNLELINAESDLKQAQINYYEALYNALVAKVDLDKATGNLK